MADVTINTASTVSEAPQSAQTSAPAPIAPPAVIEPVKPKETIGADRFAALAKQERKIREQEAKVKAGLAKIKDYESIRSQAASNPLKALEALGISYEQITNFILNGQKPTPELELKSVKDEVARMRQEQVDREKRSKEAAKQRVEQEYKEAVADFSSEINEFLNTQKDEYELTNMYNGNEIVLATIEEHFKNTKKILSVKEAADMVEKYFENEVKRAQSAKKFQTKQESKEGQGQPSKEKVTNQSSPTLSNGMTSSAPSLLSPKTEADRINRAMAALSKAS